MNYIHSQACTQNLSDSELIAYHRGYQAGFDFGVLECAYDAGTDLGAAYHLGYDAGVLAFWEQLDEGAAPD